MQAINLNQFTVNLPIGPYLVYESKKKIDQELLSSKDI